MNSKRGGTIFLLVLSILVITPFISAAQGDFFYEAQATIRPVIDSILGILNPFLEVAVGDYSTSQFFFAKVLLFILLFVVLSSIMKELPRIGDNKAVANIVSLIISILAVRFMSENQLILGVLLPYGTLGIAITTIIPFMAFFYFLHASKMGGAGRKLAWGFFIIVFFVLWNARYEQLDPLGNRIYGWGLVLMIAVLIFDKSVHRYFSDVETNRFVKQANEGLAARLQGEYQDLVNVQSKEAERRRKAIRKTLRRLGADT